MLRSIVGKITFRSGTVNIPMCNALVLADIRSMADLVVADEEYARKQFLSKKSR